MGSKSLLYRLPENQQRRCFTDALERQTERNETNTQAAVRALDKMKEKRGISSSLLNTLSPFLLGLAGIIDVFINEHGVEAASDPAMLIAYRMLYAAVMRLKGGDVDMTARLEAYSRTNLDYLWPTTSSRRPEMPPRYASACNTRPKRRTLPNRFQLAPGLRVNYRSASRASRRANIV